MPLAYYFHLSRQEQNDGFFWVFWLLRKPPCFFLLLSKTVFKIFLAQLGKNLEWVAEPPPLSQQKVVDFFYMGIGLIKYFDQRVEHALLALCLICIYKWVLQYLSFFMNH